MKLFVTILCLTFNLAYGQIKTTLINESDENALYYFQYANKKMNIFPLVKLINPKYDYNIRDHILGFNRNGMVNFRIFKSNLFYPNSEIPWKQNLNNSYGMNGSLGSMSFPYKNGKYFYLQQNPFFSKDSFRPIDLSIIDCKSANIEIRNKALKSKVPNLGFWISRINTDSFLKVSIHRNLDFLISEILTKDSMIFFDTMRFVPYTPMFCPPGFYEPKGIMDIKTSNSGRFILTDFIHEISIRYRGYDRKYLKYERTFNINEIDPITHKILPTKTLKNFLVSGDELVVEKLRNDSIFVMDKMVFSPLDSLLFQTFWHNGELRQYSMNENFKLKKQTLTIKYQDTFFWFNPIVTQDFCLLWATIRPTGKTKGVVYFHRLKNADDGLKPGNLEQYFDSLEISDGKILAPKSFKRQLLNFAHVNHSVQYKCGEGIVQFVNASYARKKFNKFDFELDLMNGQFFKSNMPNCTVRLNKNGRYPFFCKFETAEGYVELVEDTVEINLPQFYYFNDTIKVKLLSASVMNNKCIQVTWNRLDQAENYEILRDGKFIAKLSDTIFRDYFKGDIGQSYQYEVIAKDSCGNYSGKSNVARTIFLKANYPRNFKTTDECISNLNWNSYEKWDSGVDHYLLENGYSEDDFSTLIKTNDTIYVDKQFLEFNVAKKCYRITAKDGTGIESMSNVVCLEMPEIMFIPTAISLNGDQLNDALYVTNTGFENITFEVYNRWGQMIYKTTNNEIKWIPPNDIIPGVYAIKITASRKGKLSIFSENLTILK